MARAQRYSLLLEGAAFTVAVSRRAAGLEDPVLDRLRIEFLDANPAARIAGESELPGRSNFFLGNDPSRWRTNVPHYERVAIDALYPHIGASFYGVQEEVAFDLQVAPGGDPRQIGLRIRGASGVSVDREGHLILQLDERTVRLSRPVAYQPNAHGGRRRVEAEFAVVDGDEVRFEIGPYDQTLPLIIDPTISYSTYLGGPLYGEGLGIAVDTAGCAYVSGSTLSLQFPLVSALYGSSKGSYEATITKFSPTGTSLVYSTYIGSSGEDFARSIAVDAAGTAFVTGITSAGDFPTANPIQPTFGGNVDAFVLKLNAAGSALVYSTYLGGSSAEEARAIAVDATGNAFVTGMTYSSTFPVANAYQGTIQGAGVPVDGFLSKLNPGGTALVFSTFFGGNGEDVSRSVIIDTQGGAWIGGSTFSTNLPVLGGLQTSNASLSGQTDGFYAHFSTSGGLLHSSYIGGAGQDAVYSMARSAQGELVLFGEADSWVNFPVKNALLNGVHINGDCFVTRLNPGVGVVFSTFLGGAGPWCSSVAFDPSGNIVLLGSSPDDFPLAGGFASALNNQGVFVTKMPGDGSRLIFSTFMANSTLQQNGNGVAVDTAGAIYVVGDADADWPAVNAYQASSGGFRNTVVAKLTSANECDFTVSPTSHTVPALGGQITYTVTTGSTCYWNVFPSNAHGNPTISSLAGTYTTEFHPYPIARGNGTVTVAIPYSGSGPDQTRTFIIAGRGVSFTHTGLGCNYTLDGTSGSFTSAGGTGSFGLAAGFDCPATAVSNAPWITIPSPNLANGGNIQYNVASNAGAARSGTISIAGLTYTVNQAAACASSFSSATQNFPIAGGTGGVNVNAPAGCVWGITVEGTTSLLNFTSASSGTGNAAVTYSISGNGFQYQQTIVLRLSSGATHTITVAGICNITPAATSANVGASGGNLSVSVTVSGTCSVMPGTSTPWIHVTSGVVSASGTVTYTVDANPDASSRQGTLEIGPYGVTVTQAGPTQPTAAFRDTVGEPRLTFQGATTFPSAGGFLSGPPAAAQADNGDAYVVGLDGAGGVWLNSDNYTASAWNGWHYSGGILDLNSRLTAAVAPDGVVWFAGKDIGHRFWINSWNGASFGGWRLLDQGIFASDSIPQIAIPADGSIYVVGKDIGGRIWSNRYVPTSNTFSGWRNRGAVMIGQPSVTDGSDGRVYIAVRSTASSPAYLTQLPADNAATANTWVNGGGLIVTDPVLVSGGGTLYVGALAAGGPVYLLTFSEGSQSFAGWSFTGGILSDITGAARGAKVYLTGRDAGNRIWWYDRSAGSWFFAGGAGLSNSSLHGAK